MYIEIRRIGKNRKYYLAHSYRKGKTIKKIKVYLGLNLSKAELKAKHSVAEAQINVKIKAVREIHDPLKTVISPAELEDLRTLEAKGKIKITHLSEVEWTKFVESFTYDTNAIEGSMVTAQEVKEILEKDRWPVDKSKEDISETYGVAKAIRYIRKNKENLSLKLIKKLHWIVFKNSKSFAGKTRKKGEEVVVADAYGNVVHRGALSTKVQSMLLELVRWYNRNKKKYPPLVLSAVIHNQFENIHPFRDGNGRVGRLLMINVLLKHGKPPINIELRNRQEYYGALQAYENQGNLRPTIELILKEYKSLRSMLKR